ncbi:hypothetical protein LXL04_017008 [Taraxacum kok-saghyz]
MIQVFATGDSVPNFGPRGAGKKFQNNKANGCGWMLDIQHPCHITLHLTNNTTPKCGGCGLNSSSSATSSKSSSFSNSESGTSSFSITSSGTSSTGTSSAALEIGMKKREERRDIYMYRNVAVGEERREKKEENGAFSPVAWKTPHDAISPKRALGAIIHLEAEHKLPGFLAHTSIRNGNASFSFPSSINESPSFKSFKLGLDCFDFLYALALANASFTGSGGGGGWESEEGDESLRALTLIKANFLLGVVSIEDLSDAEKN